MTKTIKQLLLIATLIALAGCSAMVVDSEKLSSDTAGRYSALDKWVPELLRRYSAAGAGIGIIENGALVWTGFYGEQGSGTPATSTTVFNTASVAKTVTAESLIALSAKGLIDLDEPIYPYVDHSLSSDPRYRLLTARMLLAHRGGLLNWPYSYEDGQAAFITEPGQSFSYSGMGIELAARYAEAKLGRDFEELTFEYLLTPLGISDMAMGRRKPWMQNRLAVPMDSDGQYFEIATSDGRLSTANADGSWSGADDLLTTVDAYAQFLTAVMSSEWLDREHIEERVRILSPLEGDDIWDCAATESLTCANNYGHALGWMVYEFDDHTVVKHGGNDRGENALVIFSPNTGNGVVILINGGNGIFVSTQILGLVGEEADIAEYYRALVSKFYNVDLPAKLE